FSSRRRHTRFSRDWSSDVSLPIWVIAEPGGEDRPYLVYLQGGPGSEAPRPLDASNPPWLPRALREHRVIMLDQRGTGRSTPVGLDRKSVVEGKSGGPGVRRHLSRT